MVDTAQLLELLRRRNRLPGSSIDRVREALDGGRSDPAAVLAQLGLSVEEISDLMEELSESAGEPDATMLEEVTATAVSVSDEPSVDDLISRLIDMTPRFELQGELARGAMGRILAAWDLHLGRPVAIKLLRKSGPKDLDRIRFLEEAQVTGQLQHPSIMPVYELGRLRGQVAFVMRRIEGRSLKQVIAGMRRGDPEIRRQFGLVRVLNVFHQVCMAVAFAHTRSVVHRDLKPSNVMVGDFGEVVLLDWGLCKIVGGGTRTSRSTSDRWRTVHGQIIGTPAYMAPEQAMGLIDQVDARTDVYGLGAILYHLLTLRPPFSGKSNREIVNRVLKERVVPPSERAPDADIPAGLEAILMRCLARDPADRYANARALADAITEYLEAPTGSVAIGDVEPLVQDGLAAMTRHQGLMEDAALVQDTLETARTRFAPDDPPEVKQEAWEAESRLRALSIEVADAFARALGALQRAVALAPGHVQARQLLCELLVSRHDLADARGDIASAAYYRRMLAEVDGARHERLVANEGSLLLEVLPRGAVVTMWRYVEHRRRLTQGAAEDLGPAPIHLDNVPAGVYRIEARAADRAPLVTNVVVQAGRRARVRLRMLSPEHIPEGFVHVPAGTFRYGNAEGPFQVPTEQALPDFFVARHPVTAGQWLAWLRALRRIGTEELHRRIPRALDGRALWPVDHDHNPRLPGPDDAGGPWRPEMPVVGVSAEDALAFCRWMTGQSGRAVRLPTEEEWEKAARGPEGRAFPWGDRWEPAYAAGPDLWPGPWPPSVGYNAADVSSYGAGDFAGGVREWTSSVEAGAGRRHVVRGGSFLTGGERGRPLWFREALPARRCAPDIGFRLVADLD